MKEYPPALMNLLVCLVSQRPPGPSDLYRARMRCLYRCGLESLVLMNAKLMKT